MNPYPWICTSIEPWHRISMKNSVDRDALMFGTACKSARAINRTPRPKASEVVNWGPVEELVLAAGQSHWSYTWNRKAEVTDPVSIISRILRSLLSIFLFPPVARFFRGGPVIFWTDRVNQLNVLRGFNGNFEDACDLIILCLISGNCTYSDFNWYIIFPVHFIPIHSANKLIVSLWRYRVNLMYVNQFFNRKLCIRGTIMLECNEKWCPCSDGLI